MEKKYVPNGVMFYDCEAIKKDGRPCLRGHWNLENMRGKKRYCGYHKNRKEKENGL